MRSSPLVLPPTRIDGVPSGREHKLVLKAHGYKTREIWFTVREGETKSFPVTLIEGDPNTGTLRVNGSCARLTVNGTPYPMGVDLEVPAGKVAISCTWEKDGMTKVLQITPQALHRVVFPSTVSVYSDTGF